MVRRNVRHKGMEQLKAYIAQNPGHTDAQWARMFGISRSHFTEIRNGTALPSKSLMARIAKETSDGVPVTAWFPVTA